MSNTITYHMASNFKYEVIWLELWDGWCFVIFYVCMLFYVIFLCSGWIIIFISTFFFLWIYPLTALFMLLRAWVGGGSCFVLLFLVVFFVCLTEGVFCLQYFVVICLVCCFLGLFWGRSGKCFPVLYGDMEYWC